MLSPVQVASGSTGTSGNEIGYGDAPGESPQGCQESGMPIRSQGVIVML